MGNPMLPLLNQNNSGANQAVQMYKAYQTAQNPALMLQQLTAQNPILSQIRQMGNPQQAFYTLCQQRGVDPQSILSQFQ
jgi:hypothetical protein